MAIEPGELKPETWLLTPHADLIRVVAMGVRSLVIHERGRIAEVRFDAWRSSQFWRDCRVVSGEELRGYLIRDFEESKRRACNGES